MDWVAIHVEEDLCLDSSVRDEGMKLEVVE